MEGKLVGSVCVLCGVAVLNAQTHHECRPQIDLCAPPTLHHPDLPHKDHGPAPRYVVTFLASASST
jgi:hypothetical protein